MGIINRKREMQISEAELSSMTAEMEMLHQETFPVATKLFGDIAADIAHQRSSDGGFGRRGFLAGVGGVALIGGLAACSSSGGGTKNSEAPPSSGSPTGSTTAGASKYKGDYQVVALAAALENLAVSAYSLVGTTAGKGTYGKVPDAIVQFVTVAGKQHADHAAGWNSVLSKAGLPTIKDAPLTITKDAVANLQAAKTIPDVAKQALALENAAAETYTFATAHVNDANGIAVAATIAPVETMHAAILSFVLGEYPVPNSFIGITNAVQPSALTA